VALPNVRFCRKARGFGTFTTRSVAGALQRARHDAVVAVHPNPSLKDVDLSTVDLLALFRQLKEEPDPSRPGWNQARGRGLERLLHEALRRAGLDPRPPYRPSGEELDGSFKFEGRYFLYEAKWLGDEPPASTIYSFKGKIGGKLVGTIGFFISVTGFSTDAIDALASGKEKDVLLVTGEDLEAALASPEKLRRMLDLKLRAAAEDGVLNFSVQALVQESALEAPAEPTTGTTSVTRELTVRWNVEAPSLPTGPARPTLVLLVEGAKDARLLAPVLELVAERDDLDIAIEYVPAAGKTAAIPLAARISRSLANGDLLVVLVDSDDDPASRKKDLNEQLQLLVPGALMVFAEPTLEAALGVPELRAEARPRPHQIETAADAIMRGAAGLEPLRPILLALSDRRRSAPPPA
jgi:hypothetical protein